VCVCVRVDSVSSSPDPVKSRVLGSSSVFDVSPCSDPDQPAAPSDAYAAAEPQQEEGEARPECPTTHQQLLKTLTVELHGLFKPAGLCHLETQFLQTQSSTSCGGVLIHPEHQSVMGRFTALLSSSCC